MLIPSISFTGNCDEAIEFYKNAVGADVLEVYRFRDAPPDHGMDENTPPDFVMHAELIIFGTKVIMSDGGTVPPNTNDSFYFTLFLDTDEDVVKTFNGLADGGKVLEPLAPQFFASMHGFAEDKFGVGWSINAKSS